MDYISVKEFAQKYGVSERTARNYCASGKIEGVVLVWQERGFRQQRGTYRKHDRHYDIGCFVDYAIDQKADFILAHHPIIFSKINKCTSDDFLQKKLLKLIRHDICAYGMHTCYDVCRMGDQVADRLNLKEIQGPVELSKSHNEKAFGKGIGIVAKIEDEISVGEYAKKVKEAFSLENVIVFGNQDTKISKLAVVPGSGRSMISEAKSTGADVFLTGDIGHHEGLDAVDMGMCVIDAGHYGLEQVFIDDMKDLIRTHFSDMNVITYKAGSPYKVV